MVQADRKPFRVDIEFHPKQVKLLVIPEKIIVPQYSVVQWNIVSKDMDLFESKWREGLIFTLYFNDASPFLWKRQFIQLHDSRQLYPEFPRKILRLAEDVAEKKGDYKYGVSISEAETDETLYDEDPYISVI